MQSSSGSLDLLYRVEKTFPSMVEVLDSLDLVCIGRGGRATHAHTQAHAPALAKH